MRDENEVEGLEAGVVAEGSAKAVPVSGSAKTTVTVRGVRTCWGPSSLLPAPVSTPRPQYTMYTMVLRRLVFVLLQPKAPGPGWGKPTVTWSPEVHEVLDISTIGCTANHYGNTQVADDASK